MKRSLLSVKQLDDEWMNKIIFSGQNNPDASYVVKHREALRRYVVGILFEQPSHRTKNSFQSAAIRLGASVIDFTSSFAESLSRGESMIDFFRTAENFVDVLIIRSHNPNLVYDVDKFVNIPIINAGNGRDEHPTQALGDLSLLYNIFPKLANLEIALIGALRDSRCANSIVLLLSRFNVKFILVSPPHLSIRPDVKIYADKLGASVAVSHELADALNANILYWTGALPEDFEDPADYQKYKAWFSLDQNKVARLRSDAIVLHPLPHGDELPQNCINNSGDMIFMQVKHGMKARIGLLATIFE